MFAEKATKINKIFTVNLTICSNRQINGEDFVNFCGLLRKHKLNHMKIKFYKDCVKDIKNMSMECKLV